MAGHHGHVVTFAVRVSLKRDAKNLHHLDKFKVLAVQQSVFDTNFLYYFALWATFFCFFSCPWFFFGRPAFKDLLPIKTQRRLVKMSNLSTKGNKSYNKLLSHYLVFTLS